MIYFFSAILLLKRAKLPASDFFIRFHFAVTLLLFLKKKNFLFSALSRLLVILAAFKGRMVVKTYFFKQTRFERSLPGFAPMNLHECTVVHFRGF